MSSCCVVLQSQLLCYGGCRHAILCHGHNRCVMLCGVTVVVVVLHSGVVVMVVALHVVLWVL